MYNVNDTKFPCKISAKIVHNKEKCNNLNYLDGRYLQNCDESWYCRLQYSFPFNFLSSNKNSLTCCTSADSDSNFMRLEELRNDHNSSLF